MNLIILEKLKHIDATRVIYFNANTFSFQIHPFHQLGRYKEHEE